MGDEEDSSGMGLEANTQPREVARGARQRIRLWAVRRHELLRDEAYGKMLDMPAPARIRQEGSWALTVNTLGATHEETNHP
mgnify:CR=1 FL=1